jgi:hypothetical protein
MKYLWLVVPLLLTGCSSIRWVTVDHGQLVTQDNRPVNIVGNPPMVCKYIDSSETYPGYFMYYDSGLVVLDNFGQGTIYLVGSPICKLGYAN